VANALLQALSADPPANLALELVLAGAGEGGNIGIRRHLRSRRRELKRANAIVIGLAPSGSGRLHYWCSDGRLIPLAYARPLRALASQLPAAAPHRDRGATSAQPARARGLAAIAIGCLDHRGLAPHSHQPSDTQAATHETALDQTLEFALGLVDAINASLAPTQAEVTPA
jgi:hypothetical protein